jgi:serine phosphatase RsbU (regulator of sigma subunit)
MADASMEERLSNLLAVTDVSLTRLDVDDLLVEVLERLRSILEADTAAVLLREHQGDDYLVARAACGLEDEVRQGVRVPIGAGFAGTIAARREPVILDRVDSTTVANPVLWEKGVLRMVGVPLLVATDLIGVLHVGRLENRSFNQHDVELLQVAAERIAAAVQTRRLAVESAAAAMLERELMPSRLPTLPGLQLAARYAPAEDRSIGGDWYDAFVLPSGQLWVVIGDVAGHGLSSAVVVSRVRSAVRSYALLGGHVSDVLAMTNRKLLHFEIDTMVTAICAVAEPPYERFTISTAGHPPPVLATPTGTDLVDVVPGPPLGAIEDARYPSTTVVLPTNSTMLLYTDGLIERRGEAVDVGLQRLCSATANDAPESVCRDVMLRLVGSTSTVDDVALLAIGRGDQPETGAGTEALVAELRLAPGKHVVAQARAFAMHSVGDVPSGVRSVLKLLVSELATNSVVHAATDFTIRVFRSADQVRVECTDSGSGRVHTPDAEPNDTRGRGIFFVRNLADDWGVQTNAVDPGKTVWFVLRLSPSVEAAAGA